MATIEIDGKPYEAESGQMLIEVADANGIDIPRFCYHKKLSIAASCRMCLVEVVKAPKPVPACATPVADGMQVFTRSTRALMAQKSVMEFLLINHPLDCPICDQGGECELQDVAVGYGKDVSRYLEEKRVVLDKGFGPLIATEMTRCIHCTRCVRFGVEISGIQELGATGRGDRMRIGTYIEKNLTSELSGNVIDLCPVGALTAKPSRFAARAWEMQEFSTIAPHDAVGSHLCVHVRRNQVLRVAPRENEAINEVWISDRDRFSYQGLYAKDRLTVPMIKKEGIWQETDWETALAVAVDGLKQVVQKNPLALGALAAPTATLEELYLFQKLVRGIGSPHVDHRLHEVDFSDQDQAPLFPWLGQPIVDLERCDSALIIGSHLRKEQPLLNHRLRKAALHHAQMLVINPIDYEFNFPLAEKIIVSPAMLPQTLAGIIKALRENGSKKSSKKDVDKSLLAITVTEEQQRIAEQLRKGEKTTILLGNLAHAHPQAALLRSLAGMIAELSGARLGFLPETANTAGAWLAGVVPHRIAGGNKASKVGLTAHQMLTQTLPAYLLLNVEPELDSWNSAATLQTLNKAECVVALTAYRTPAMDSYAKVLLPIASFTETSGTYVNCEGVWQSFNGIVNPPQEARPAWKILRVFGNLFNLKGFDYTTPNQISAELRQLVGNKQPELRKDWQLPANLTTDKQKSGLQRITEMPIYATDSLVRRAEALQRTPDATIAKGIHLHPKTANQKGLKEHSTVQARQLNGTVSLPLVLDERVPEGCALIYSGVAENVELGEWYGQVEVMVSS